MCGIVGVVGERASRELVHRMAAAVAHRGPDDEGIWAAGGIGLGHRRLSIIDLSSAGHQPMTSHDGRYTLVYNGEIYNYREIARSMPDVVWRGHSDSEVLLEAFSRWGPACLDQLIGMFAIAIWDRAEQRLFCARDRLGIKPLYYARDGGTWLFGSEIGAVHAAGVSARPNERIIYDFLARDFYEHADETFFEGVNKLPPGHWMWLRAGHAPELHCYWRLIDEVAKQSISESRVERGERLIEMMQDAVRFSLRSDVPFGVALSGGLDSAVLLALVDGANEAPPEHVKTFSFDFAEEQYSERPWVDAMAKHTNHPVWFRKVSSEDFVTHAMDVNRQQQEPHAGAPIVAYTLCFEMLRAAGVIVVMDGSGIDEGLAGYARFAPAHWADLQRTNPDGLARELAAAGVTIDQARARMAAAMSSSGDVGVGQDLSSSVRPDCMSGHLRSLNVPMPEFDRPFLDALRNLMYRELRYTKLPRALRFRDRLSMAYGCELRPPFLDHRLLGYMFALPAIDRIDRGVSKSLLREAAARLLPDTVRMASKRSVQTPQREWFRGDLASWVRRTIDQKSFWDRGWVERDKALEALGRFQAGEGDNSFFAWQWIALEQWASTFLD